MIEEGFLYEDDKGVFRTVVREYYSMDIRAILKKIRHGVDMFDVSLAGTDGCFLATHTESLSLAGIKAIKKAAKDFYFTVAKNQNNEKYSGKFLFMPTLCWDCSTPVN